MMIHNTKNMVAPIFVLSLLLGCTLHEIKVHEEYDIKDIMNRYGTPSISTIILKKDVSLYEYQGGLVEYIPQKDSLSITQYYFVRDNINIVIWGIPLENGKIKILDILEWDKNKIQF